MVGLYDKRKHKCGYVVIALNSLCAGIWLLCKSAYLHVHSKNSANPYSSQIGLFDLNGFALIGEGFHISCINSPNILGSRTKNKPLWQ